MASEPFVAETVAHAACVPIGAFLLGAATPTILLVVDACACACMLHGHLCIEATAALVWAADDADVNRLNRLRRRGRRLRVLNFSSAGAVEGGGGAPVAEEEELSERDFAVG